VVGVEIELHADRSMHGLCKRAKGDNAMHLVIIAVEKPHLRKKNTLAACSSQFAILGLFFTRGSPI